MTVGFVTSSDAVVCCKCVDLLEAHRMGRPVYQVLSPSENGRYLHQPLAKHYDDPCAICGWPLRVTP